MSHSDPVVPDSEIYKKFDEQDEIQIINSEKYLASGQWLYEVQGQYSISYDGIRAFASWLARHGITVQTISSEITMRGEKEEGMFHAKVRVKEANTGVIFEGISSQSQYGARKDGTRYYDSTAETKSHSKAERNAIRKHIPPDLIAQFIEETKKTGKVKTLKETGECHKSHPNKKTNSTWCKCEKPKVRFRAETQGKHAGCHTCVACDLPVQNAEQMLKDGDKA